MQSYEVLLKLASRAAHCSSVVAAQSFLGTVRAIAETPHGSQAELEVALGAMVLEAAPDERNDYVSCMMAFSTILELTRELGIEAAGRERIDDQVDERIERAMLYLLEAALTGSPQMEDVERACEIARGNLQWS